jgi:hypothetical protein
MSSPVVSRSGRKFSKRGVKQVIKVGSLLRSLGYGSRIVQVIAKVRVKLPEGDVRHCLILRHFCNTSHFDTINPHDTSGRWPYHVDSKGNRHRGKGEMGQPFLSYGASWDVVREIVGKAV